MVMKMTHIDRDLVFDIHAPLDQERKFNHGEIEDPNPEDCGDKRERFYVRRTTKGWLYHCFNCGIKGFKGISAKEYATNFRDSVGQFGIRSIHPRLQVSGDQVFSLPRQAPMSREGREWLDKYGITDEEEERYGIYYTDEYAGRIVLPIYEQRRLPPYCQGYQLRRLSGDRKFPKYITRKKEGETLRFWARKEQSTNDSTTVVVEDILSAIIVGRQCQALSLLGSPKKLPDDVFSLLQSRPGNIAFWLDPDKFAGSIDYAKRFISLDSGGRNVVAIRSDKDPKDYSDEEIRIYLQRAFPNGTI